MQSNNSAMYDKPPRWKRGCSWIKNHPIISVLALVLPLTTFVTTLLDWRDGVNYLVSIWPTIIEFSDHPAFLWLMSLASLLILGTAFYFSDKRSMLLESERHQELADEREKVRAEVRNSLSETQGIIERATQDLSHKSANFYIIVNYFITQERIRGIEFVLERHKRRSQDIIKMAEDCALGMGENPDHRMGFSTILEEHANGDCKEFRIDNVPGTAFEISSGDLSAVSLPDTLTVGECGDYASYRRWVARSAKITSFFEQRKNELRQREKILYHQLMNISEQQ